MGRTTIQVSDELADELHNRKDRGDSYEDVIWRLIETTDHQPSRRSQTTNDGSPTRPDTATTHNHLADIDFPAGRDRDDCIEAITAAYEYLQHHEKATMRDFVTQVMPDHPLGYEVPDLEPGDRYRGSWWRKIIKPGLKELPDVEAPPPGSSKWRHQP